MSSSITKNKNKNDNKNNNLLNYCSNDDVIQFKQLVGHTKLTIGAINKFFMECCKNGCINIIKFLRVYENVMYKNDVIKYDNGCELAIKNNHSYIITYLFDYTESKYFNTHILFAFCCANNYIDMAKMIYSFGCIVISQLYIQETSKMCSKIITDTNIIEWLLKTRDNESNNYIFIKLCKNNNLEIIKKFYETNDVLINFDNYKALHNLCLQNDTDCIKWFMSIHKLSDHKKLDLLINLCQNDNLKLATEINNVIKVECAFKYDMFDTLCLSLHESFCYIAIKNLHLLGYLMINDDLILLLAIEILKYEDDEYEYFKWFYSIYQHVLEKTDDNKKDIYCLLWII